ncbi:MAG: formylmethanofuran dehydrogenase subunit C [Planctomycetes bacterium]|nr:formylmethanofuran dehydrogenase subunit C [Planctomycetota bacterium]
MSILLRLRNASPIPIEAECLSPDRLEGLAVKEIERLEVDHGNERARVADFFEVGLRDGNEAAVIEGDCSRVKHIGAGMTRGLLVVDGNAGMHAGAEMSGGRLEVRGNAGDWTGAEMRAGRIHIRGDAGHLLGGAYRGSRTGMRGGVILVEGSARNEVGCSMRRGLIAVRGQVGDFPGVSMHAGNILVGGLPGVRAGAGMRRGSLIFFGETPGDSQRQVELLPTFSYDCTYRPPFVSLYLKKLQSWKLSLPVPAGEGRYRRYSGDLVESGKGEILVWQA